MKLNDYFNAKVATVIPKKYLTDGDIGVELEFEGENFIGVPGWEMHPENSLRGNAMEYVTAGAVPYSGLKGRLDIFNLHSQNMFIKLTNRASTHIHINMQKETWKDVISFITLFSILEPVLLRTCGPQRDGNLFCLSSYDTGDLLPHIARFIEVTRQGAPTAIGRRGKYAAMNMDPLTQSNSYGGQDPKGPFGTIEVRCFPNTKDMAQVYQWATWLMNIRGFSKKWADPLNALVDYAYNEPHNLVYKIFTGLENQNTYSLFSPHTLNELITVGVETGHEIAKLSKDMYAAATKRKKLPVNAFAIEPGSWNSPDEPPEPFWIDEEDEH